MAKDLLAVQLRFARALKDAEDLAVLDDLVAPPALTDAAECLAVYRGNVIANRLHALQLSYPVVRQMVGDAFFEGLARAHRHAQPSASGNLDKVGEGFACFLRAFEPARSLPYLAEVAALEWRVADLQRATDVVPIEFAELGRLQPDQLGGCRLELRPGMAIQPSRWPLATIWQQHQPEWQGEIDVDLAIAESALVWREGWKVRVSALDAAETATWQGLQQGLTVAEALSAGFDIDSSFDAGAVLQRGFARGLVTAITVVSNRMQSS